MYTSIVFVIDTHSLPNPGTYQQPAWTQHFPQTVTRDGGAPTKYEPGQVVRAGLSDRVDISFIDTSLGLAVEIAPVLLLAHAWNQKVLTPADLASSNPNKPIDMPRFDVTRRGAPKMQYAGDETGWGQVQGADHLYWSDGAKIGQNVAVSVDNLYGPYATFNLQGIPGVLEYGVGFAVSKDGKNIGYYYFDPQIQAG
ncbi:MAG TPA: hypothetical protein VLS89_16760 [Candidatus Nanopelagicales bacterium]|nr:hypothetical protein [Candidatus Nanopelagicales bacterium]